MGIPLSHLISVLHPVRVEGGQGCEVAGVAFDSRQVLPGTLYVALRGRKHDGHDHIGSAIERGACAVVSERRGAAAGPGTWIQVEDSRVALARVSAAFYGYASRDLKVVGVTGTSGKTTVSFLVRHLLERCGQRVGMISTVHHEVGGRVIPAQRTTPEAVEVQSMLAQMRLADCGVCVMEVSSLALDQRRVDEVEFDVGVFTNLSSDHLDYHGSMAGYYAAKRRLFDLLGHGAKVGTAVINHDDETGRRLIEDLPGLRRITYGFGGGADVRGRVLRLDADGSDLEIETVEGTVRCRLPLIGRFNSSNALAAVGAGMALGFSPDRLVEALRSAPQVPGRLERVDVGQPFSVLVDYAHTADAMRHVLETLREITSGSLRVVFGCGGGRDPGKRAVMGRVAGELADDVVVTSDNPRQETASEIAGSIEDGLREAGGAAWCVELDRARAIEEAIGSSGVGDAVLVAGKGHECFQEFGDSVMPFDDRQQVLEALAVWREGWGKGEGAMLATRDGAGAH